MYIQHEALLNHIGEKDVVLDIGSHNDIFPRANIIIDINDYETRKRRDLSPEYFNKSSWIKGDLSEKEVWSLIPDKSIDFVICSHLLEDIRDPLFVCEQLIRVAKKGYIEVPSYYREISKATHSDTSSGYDHHRWIVEYTEAYGLTFKAKLSWANCFDYLGEHRRDYLDHYAFHFSGYFWDTTFNFNELCPKGNEYETANILYRMDQLKLAELNPFLDLPNATRDSKKIVWVDKYELDVEKEKRSLTDKYYRKSRLIHNL